MAKAASADAVSLDQNGPDYDSALGEIKNIMDVEQRARKVSGTKTANWKKIDDFRVDRTAAGIVKSILNLATDNRTMTLRSLFGLLIAAKEEIDLPGDLVDMMHKAIPTGLHVETPGSVRPKPRSAPKPDQKKEEKVVPLRQVKKEEPAAEEDTADDRGAPQPDVVKEEPAAEAAEDDTDADS